MSKLLARARRDTTGAVVVLRHGSWRTVVQDLLLLLLAGSLVAFVVLLTTRAVVDRVVFEASLDYDSRGPAPAEVPGPVRDAGGTTVLQVEQLNVAAPVASGSGGARLADFEQSRRLTAWVAGPEGSESLARLLGAAVTSGTLQAGTVALDVASAHDFGVRPGDTVVLVSYDEQSDLVECQVQVGALLRPFHEPEEVGEGGLVALAAPTCEDVLGGMTDGSRRGEVFTAAGSPAPDGATTKAAALRGVGIDAARGSGLVLAVLGIGVLLWVAAVLRVTTRLLGQMGPAAVMLVQLGWSPRAARACLVTAATALSAAGALGAGLLARLLVLQVAGFYTQLLHLLIVVLLLGGTAVVVSTRATRPTRLAPGGP